MKRFLKLAILTSCCLAGALSCKDGSYDLDRLSREVSVGGDFVLPLGNTVILHLEDIARLDSLKNFYCDLEGNYFFEYCDSLFFAFPRIEKEKLTIPPLQFISAQLPLSSNISLRANLPIKLEKRGLPKEVIAIDSLALVQGAKLFIDFKAADLPSAAYLNLEIDFPDEFVFAASSKVSAEGHYEFDGFLDESGCIRDSLILGGFRCGGTIRDSTLSIDARVPFTATLSASVPSAPVNASITLGFSEMTIQSVCGLIDPGLESLSVDIDLSEIPDEFRNEDNCYDLLPLFCLGAHTNVDVPFIAEADIIPVIDEIERYLSAQEVVLDIEQFCDKTFWIGTDAKGVPFGAEFHAIDSRALVEQLPDSLKLKVDVKTDTSSRGKYDMFKDYSFDIEYLAKLPLSIGKDFQLFFEDTVRLKNIEKIVSVLEKNDFEILGQIENTFPFDIEIEVIPVDRNLEPLDIETAVSSVKGSGDGKAVLTNFSAVFKDLESQLKNLDGFILNFEGISAAEGRNVTKDQYIKASFSAKANGGINLKL